MTVSEQLRCLQPAGGRRTASYLTRELRWRSRKAGKARAEDQELGRRLQLEKNLNEGSGAETCDGSSRLRAPTPR